MITKSDDAALRVIGLLLSIDGMKTAEIKITWCRYCDGPWMACDHLAINAYTLEGNRAIEGLVRYIV